MLKRFLALLAFGYAANAGAFGLLVPTSVVEYVNEATGSYRLVAAGSTVLDDGGEGGRWVRTGFVFQQYLFTQSEASVCQFHSPLHSAYFYTPYATECEFLKRPGTGWTFQGEAFRAPPPGVNGCPGGEALAVHRLFDGGSNHRYSADAGIIAGMLQRGWVDEGIGFCTHGAGVAPERAFDAQLGMQPMPKSLCESRVGSCVALTELAPMGTRVSPYLPPQYFDVNPGYPSIRHVVGVSGQDLYTSITGGANDVLQRSFYMVTGGVHLAGSDRLSGPYAGLSPMYQLQGGVGPTLDERVFPWRNGRERDLVIRSVISVTRLTRGNPASDAYGMQLIHFADRVSGRRFYVTLQAFGVSVGGDYIGADFSTGRAIVSTSYRENPLFGRRISGDATRCNPAFADCLPRTTFAFELSKADFEAVLGHARRVDPLLTTDPANYFVSSFHQHNETYLDATIGMAVYGLRLEIWPRVQ